MNPRYHPYVPRPLQFDGLRLIRGFQLKVYTILYGDRPLERATFEGGLATACETLPEPARGEGRPGVGFVILHQGRGADYVVLCWWDRENELPTRVFVRDGETWRAARDGESFCVWDLHVIWHERQAYVATVLDGNSANSIEAYLASTAEGTA